MKILNVVGARPNFIKISPLVKEFRSFSEIEPKIVHTGQHYDKNMSRNFFDELEIPEPDYNLGIGSGSHAEQTGKIMIEFEKACIKEKPDIVLVVGDVNSTIAAALVAVKLQIKLVHVEAGMRSYDMTMPEEINRKVTDHVADINFCPTQTAYDNLKKEGINNGIQVGDIMHDSFKHFSSMAEKKSTIITELGLRPGKYILLTIHRPGNTDDRTRLGNIVTNLCSLEETIVFPVHPRTKKMLIKYGLFEKLARKVQIIDAVSYLDMLQLMKNSKLLMTDSGGMQKEAYLGKVPCITLRDRTEWVETLENGNILCKHIESLPELIKKQLTTPYEFKKELYGDGKTAKKIVEVLLNEVSR